ncbi:MAG TPA: hypothetical protein VN668_13425 [Stellaceae bacterium]|nr:hypothetical protein [Stellaceae bacterium]
MADPYFEPEETLVQFYAERMSKGFGPAVERKLGWTIRDAEAEGDRRRARFWQKVSAAARQAQEAAKR